MSTDNNILISIVIPTYNESTYISRLLTDLNNQTFKDFEVIVSDANSKDDTKSVVKNFSANFPITLVLSPPKGPADGRNKGANKAKGEWLLFLDADISIDDKNFIKTILEQTTKLNIKTTSTNTRIANPSLSEKIGLRLHYYYLRLLAKTKHPVAPGFCIFTDKSLFNQLSGFDTSLWVAEDYDYVSRAHGGGFKYIDETYYYVDLRRFQEGGNFKIYLQSMGYEIYRFTHGYKIKKDPFNYEFGAHTERNK